MRSPAALADCTARYRLKFQPAMPGFRWDIKLDLALCLEVFSLRPQTTPDWEKVASTIKDVITSTQGSGPVTDGAADSSAEGSPTVHIPKARGCKERMQLLIKKYKEDDKRALKRHASSSHVIISIKLQ